MRIAKWLLRKRRVVLELRCQCGGFWPASYSLDRLEKGAAPMTCDGCGVRAQVSLAGLS